MTMDINICVYMYMYVHTHIFIPTVIYGPAIVLFTVEASGLPVEVSHGGNSSAQDLGQCETRPSSQSCRLSSLISLYHQ